MSNDPDPTERTDWRAALDDLERCGHALLPGFLSAEKCSALRDLYDQRARFRSFVDMERHGFGRGDYRYFAYPLPALVRSLRSDCYRRLAPVANRWCERLGRGGRFPPSLGAYTEACHALGQVRATPLLLHYETEGFNCLHQDLYGAEAFPFQVAVQLSRPGVDFVGGEFLLMEGRPRRQSRAEAITLARGDALIFPNASRPVAGKRGWYAATVKHGVSRLRAGERFTLGLIFHDAQ